MCLNYRLFAGPLRANLGKPGEATIGKAAGIRIHLQAVFREQERIIMSKRKPKNVPQPTPRLKTPDLPPSFMHPVHGRMFTINVSANMLGFIQRMATDPAYRSKVQKLR